MKAVRTLEELNQLPPRSIIVGPSWDDELYQKSDYIHWHTPGSTDDWDGEQLEHRGPFAVLREGEILDDEERPMVLPKHLCPSDTSRFVLRIDGFPIGQTEVKPDGAISLHYSREDVINQVASLLVERLN